MKSLLQRLHQRPISYYPIYRDITNSSTAAILLSQLMFWFSYKDKFYKTDLEFKTETRLTDNELRSAKKAIKNLSFIKVAREGIPAKTYYEIDWQKYETTLLEFANSTVSLNSPNKTGEKNEDPQSSLVKSTKLDSLNSPNSDSEIHETINVIQKNTSKNTSKNTLSPKSSLTKKSQPEVDSNSTEKEERRERKFLNFVNQIRERYKPDSARDFFPTILEQVKINEKGEVGKLKIDNKGHLYIKYKYELQDLSANEADRVWRWMFDHQEKIVPIKNQKKETA